MLQALLLGTLLGVATTPADPPGAGPDGSSELAPAVVHAESATEAFVVAPVRLEEARPPLTPPPSPQEEGAAKASQADAGRFIYNVAVGVAVTVLSALILRAIL